MFENSIRRLGFFVPSNGHQNCFDKSLKMDCNRGQSSSSFGGGRGTGKSNREVSKIQIGEIHLMIQEEQIC